MKVYVKTPARLHFGLIDMNGSLGRLFGGIGLAIDQPNVILEAEQSEHLSVIGEKADLAKSLVQRFLQTYNVHSFVSMNVKQTIPDHVGLGSGTQLALAVSTALTKLFNVEASTQQLALSMGRAQRTGVGTAVFEKGGFVVDGGKSTCNSAYLYPPLIFRQPFPEDWRFVVVIPNTTKGLSSDKEKCAFQQVPPMATETTGKICRLIVMKLLPSLIERDIKCFGEALTEIQVAIGGSFANVQAGTYATPITAQGVEFLRKQGAYGIGQSSWGPAFYGLFKKETVQEAKCKVQRFLQANVGGQVFIAKPNNRGAYIKITR